MVEENRKKSFVLVHGAWLGGWCWKRVRPLLQAAGHTVFTPTLTGLGERSHLLNQEIDLSTHIKDVVGVLEYEDLSDVTLVGHSYAGLIISEVAERASNRLSHLIYLDAILPEDGDSFMDLYPNKPHLQNWAESKGEGWRLPFEGLMPWQALGISNQDDIAWMSHRMKDQPFKAFTQKVSLSTGAAKKLHRTYIQTGQAPFVTQSVARAKEQSVEVYQVLSAGHVSMITEPENLIQLLVL
jgi:pimeloyl-ACP methyl ester carboxylesterase